MTPKTIVILPCGYSLRAQQRRSPRPDQGGGGGVFPLEPFGAVEGGVEACFPVLFRGCDRLAHLVLSAVGGERRTRGACKAMCVETCVQSRAYKAARTKPLTWSRNCMISS